MITAFSHIGHAVVSLDKTLQKYSKLLDLEAALSIKLDTATPPAALLPVGDTIIMVVEPGNTNGIAGKYFSKYGEGLYFYALVSDNLPQEIASLKQKGISLTETEPSTDLPFRTVWVELNGAIIQLIGKDMHSWLWQKCQKGKGRARISHVGHAIRNTKSMENTYIDVLGLRKLFYLELTDEGVLSTMIPVASNYIELLEPTSDGPIKKFIDTRGEGLYHVCIAVKDAAAEMDILSSRGVKMIEIAPTPGLPEKTAWFRLSGISYELTPESMQAYLKETGKR